MPQGDVTDIFGNEEQGGIRINGVNIFAHSDDSAKQKEIDEAGILFDVFCQQEFSKENIHFLHELHALHKKKEEPDQSVLQDLYKKYIQPRSDTLGVKESPFKKFYKKYIQRQTKIHKDSLNVNLPTVIFNPLEKAFKNEKLTLDSFTAAAKEIRKLLTRDTVKRFDTAYEAGLIKPPEDKAREQIATVQQQLAKEKEKNEEKEKIETLFNENNFNNIADLEQRQAAILSVKANVAQRTDLTDTEKERYQARLMQGYGQTVSARFASIENLELRRAAIVEAQATSNQIQGLTKDEREAYDFRLEKEHEFVNEDIKALSPIKKMLMSVGTFSSSMLGKLKGASDKPVAELSRQSTQLSTTPLTNQAPVAGTQEAFAARLQDSIASTPTPQTTPARSSAEADDLARRLASIVQDGKALQATLPTTEKPSEAAFTALKDAQGKPAPLVTVTEPPQPGSQELATPKRKSPSV